MAVLLAAFALATRGLASDEMRSLSGGEIRIYRWFDGTVDAFVIQPTVALEIRLPKVGGCSSAVRLPVSAASAAAVVTLYRGADVRSHLPLGGGVPPPPAPESLARDVASGGSVDCRTTAAGRIRLTAKGLRFAAARLGIASVGPVEGIPGAVPP